MNAPSVQKIDSSEQMNAPSVQKIDSSEWMNAPSVQKINYFEKRMHHPFKRSIHLSG